tara:strand:+ start:2088 stop:3983 length:1896 start_codon:yes stop_codon:yes gene_type:complete
MIDTKTWPWSDPNDLGKLAAIIKGNEAKTRRARLRKWIRDRNLVSINSDDWDCIRATDVWKENKCRPNIGALIDRISMNALIAIASGYPNPGDEITAAMVSPDVHGVPSDAKAGYAFGHSKKMEAHTNEALPLLMETDADPVKAVGFPITSSGIQRVWNTVLVAEHDEAGTREEIIDATAKLVDAPEVIEGLREAIMAADMLEDTDDPAFADHLPELRDLITKALMDGEEITVTPTVSHSWVAVERPSEAVIDALDTVATAMGGKRMSEIFDLADKAGTELAEALAKAVDRVSSVLPTSVSAMPVAAASGTPALLSCDPKPVTDVFSRLGKGFDFKMPVFEWDSPHPDVPAVDPDYVWDKAALRRVLYALLLNKPVYLHGHTGAGKTTMIEQISAVLRWPMQRLNLHSDITQMDLLGRDRLKNDGGTTISEYEEGVLPQALRKPCLFLLDEVDFIRSGVAYILQRPLENKGLILTEDAGRFVEPHPLFRFIGAGNTQMKGDEFGMYREARIQSSAFINRWMIWVGVEYMSKPSRNKLLKAKVPTLSEELRDKLVQYTGEHLKAFTEAEIIQPLSPRDYVECATQMVSFMEMGLEEEAAVKEALTGSILDAAVPQDRQVLSGLVKNVFDINA